MLKKIKLFRAFFTPDNQLLKAGVHFVLDSWVLPKGTEILEEAVEAIKDALDGDDEDDKPALKKPAGK